MLRLALVLAVLWPTMLFGAGPVARISSNVEDVTVIEPGDPIELTADGLQEGENCKWEIVPAMTQSGKVTFKMNDDQTGATLYSRMGEYRVTLYVWKNKDLAKTTKVFRIGGVPPQTPTVPQQPIPIPQPPIVLQPPGPTPTPIPPQEVPTYGLVEVVRASILKNVPPTERHFAIDIAKAYQQGADSIAKGIWTVDKIPAMQGQLNRAIPGYNAAIWTPVGVDVANMLGVARNAGRLTTAQQWAAAWAELSLAFFKGASAQ